MKEEEFLQNILLTKNPSQCEEDESYEQALDVSKRLAVINDRVERVVTLIQDFNKKLIKDKDQLQFLLQIVWNHQRQFSDCTK